MGIFDIFRFKKHEDVVTYKKVFNRDSVVIELASILDKLYNILVTNGKKRSYINLRIIDEKSSKNCSIDDICKFTTRVNERTTTIGYELTVAWVFGEEVSEEYNDANKIKVIIKDDNINIEFLYELDFNNFNITLDEIINCLSGYDVKFNLNRVVREKKIKKEAEMVDFGILGFFNYKYIEYQSNSELSNEEYDKKIRSVLDKYHNNIELVNKRIFYNLHEQMSMTDVAIWDDESFNKIFNVELLPNNFNLLSHEEKNDLFYLFDKLDENELWDKIQLEKPFWNLSKLKDDIRITCVVINEEFESISIEFNGVCNFFLAIVEMKYNNNFEITNFDPS